MKARLEPIMVAASTQFLAPAAQGDATSPDRITASSQGGLMQPMDAGDFHLDSTESKEKFGLPDCQQEAVSGEALTMPSTSTHSPSGLIPCSRLGDEIRKSRRWSPVS